MITGTNDAQVIENAVFSIRVCLQAMGEKVYPVTASGIYILVIYLWKKKALLGDSSSEKVAEET